MVICSRCQQPVDETTRTTCPLCFTPVSASGDPAQPQPLGGPSAPPPAPAQPQGAMPLNGPAPVAVSLSGPAAPLNAPPPAPTLGANQRMTLSGDVIDAPAPMSAPAAGNSQYKPRTNYNTPQPAQERGKSGANPVVVGLVFLLLFGGGGGGWYYWMHRTNPKDQLQKFLAATKTLDAKGMYATMEVDTDKYKTEKDFVDQVDGNAAAKQFITQMLADITLTAGEPKYSGMTEATVPYKTTGTVTFNMFGQSKSQSIDKTSEVKMKNFGGIWKVSKDNTGMSGQGAANGAGLLGAMGGSR